MASHRRLILTNARLITHRGTPPMHGSVVLRGGWIEWLGEGEPPRAGELKGARRIDCQGAVVLPGFIDPHCHPLALGATLTAIDCRPGTVRSIDDIKRKLRAWAETYLTGRWITGFGYDELLLVDKRHPDRHDLDAAIPDRPVRLLHGGGHAEVLNSLGLRVAGISVTTDEPPGAVIEREPESGEPSGLLLEMSDFVSARISSAEPTEITERARRASVALLQAGVTSVADASHKSDARRFNLYAELLAGRVFQPRISVMRAPGVTRPKVRQGLSGWLGIGPVKVMLTLSAGGLNPLPAVLAEIVLEAETTGGGIAIHAIEREAVEAAANAIASADARRPGRRNPRGRYGRSFLRIEHASECPPDTCRKVRRAGAMVVTQPGFIWARGDRYLAAADREGAAPRHLYPVKTLAEHGIPLAGSSDAPFGPISPLVAVASAVDRATASGKIVSYDQRIDVADALWLYGPPAAVALGGAATGRIEAGAPADLVVLNANPLKIAPELIRKISVVMTILGGEVVYSADSQIGTDLAPRIDPDRPSPAGRPRPSRLVGIEGGVG